jgi:hypothetical protein
MRAAYSHLRTMEIGDLVTYDGKTYVLRGFEPMSVDGRLADLEDPRTGELLRAPLDELEPADV